MTLYSYQQSRPRIGARVYIAPNATVIGDVTLGDDSSIWFGTVLRGDVNRIRVGARSNIQDNCVVHVTSGRFPVEIDEDVTIGHGVIVHGCVIARGCLIGIGSRILDGAVIGEGSIVAAGAVVPEGMNVPPRSLVLGVPAKVRGEVTAEQSERARKNSAAYLDHKNIYLSDAGIAVCEEASK